MGVDLRVRISAVLGSYFYLCVKFMRLLLKGGDLCVLGVRRYKADASETDIQAVLACKCVRRVHCCVQWHNISWVPWIDLHPDRETSTVRMIRAYTRTP